MNSNPLVSIGLPTFNRATDLRRAIDSALAQDYSHLEIVISDNGSSDHTPAVCEEFCARDSRVKYVRQPVNRGPHLNFLEVLQLAQGEFFMWLGDDDWLDQSYVSRCLQKLIENPDHSLVCGDARYFSKEQSLPAGETINLPQASAAERVLSYYKQVIHNGAFYGVMRPQQLLLAWPPNGLGSDWLLIAAIAFLGRVEVVHGVAVNRSWDGSSRTLKSLTASLGISEIHARAPHLSIAIAAFRDIAWQSRAYGSISRLARLSLALRVLWVFYQKYLEPDWYTVFYPFRARPLLFAIAVRNRIRKILHRGISKDGGLSKH